MFLPVSYPYRVGDPRRPGLPGPREKAVSGQTVKQGAQTPATFLLPLLPAGEDFRRGGPGRILSGQRQADLPFE